MSVCLHENHNDFCEWFSHCFEKNIEDFIYIKNTEFFLLVHDIQNVIFDHLQKWLYCLLILKIFYVAQVSLWFFWKEAVTQHVCLLLYCKNDMLFETITEQHYYFRTAVWFIRCLVCCYFRITMLRYFMCSACCSRIIALLSTAHLLI